MAENTSIEWCHHTFNPWRGCTKVSPGCANCYADTMSKRNPSALGIWGPDGTRVVAAESYWKQPLRWDRQAAESGERLRVFCSSLADMFELWEGPIHDHRGGQLRVCDNCLHEEAWPADTPLSDETVCTGDDPQPGCGMRPVTLDDLRADVFRLADSTGNLDWLFLTKRPERIPECWPAGTLQARQQRFDYWQATGHDAPRTDEETPHRANAWLGTTVENRDTLHRIDELRKCRDLSPVLFLSCEPLLEDLGPIDLTGIDWVIAGGESGPKARVSHPQWYRNLRDQCIAAGVAFLFKQWGEWLPSDQGRWDRVGRRSRFKRHTFPGDHQHVFRVGKQRAGRELDGREWNEFPQVVCSA